jgi:hypothetical protein
MRIAVLGLNTAWLCASDEDKAKGLLLGERQTRAALEKAEAADLKIALIHHPFDWLREFDQDDSEALLEDACDFILHGHLHRASMNQLVSPDNSAMLIAGGACYDTREYPNSYNFVRLDFTAGTGTIYLRRYSDARGGFWAKDTLTYRNISDGEYTFQLPGNLRQTSLTSPDGSHTGSQDGQDQTMVTVTTESNETVQRKPSTQPSYNTAALRELLIAAFSDSELTTLCFDYFRAVYEDFSAGMGKGDKVQRLLDYATRNNAFSELLGRVKTANPAKYAEFESRLTDNR